MVGTFYQSLWVSEMNILTEKIDFFFVQLFTSKAMLLKWTEEILSSKRSILNRVANALYKQPSSSHNYFSIDYGHIDNAMQCIHERR